MIDLHTHILPAFDDGSRDTEMSLAMLRCQQQQGVDTVVLTPHCYRYKENLSHFLARRQQAWDGLRRAAEAQTDLPRLLLGAEVAWVSGMPQWDALPELCISGTRNLLLELPFEPWQDSMFRQIYELMDLQGITPVIAHLERYLKLQRRDHIGEILALGVPVQVSSSPLLSFRERGTVLKMIRSGQAGVLASDCHNMDRRPPNLSAGMDVIRKKLGEQTARSLEENARMLIAPCDSI